MPTLFQIKAFISYWLEAVDRHSLHSPFFYDLYTSVIRIKADIKTFARFENLRSQLLRNNTYLIIEDLGAGSLPLQGKTRRVSDIAKTSLTPFKFNALYHRLAMHYKAKRILELGTSFGINTLYLAVAGNNSTITTLEGVKPIADIAQLTFTLAEANNVSLLEGNITQTLPSFLQSTEKLDVVFIDANHRYAATKSYFELIVQKTHHNSVIIVDDIHYSAEMERAWNEIRGHRAVYATADLYRCGLVFFDPSLNKQHVVLQF